jgi:hypothetical protein
METVLAQFEILLLYLLGEIEDIHESLSHFSRSPGRDEPRASRIQSKGANHSPPTFGGGKL